MIRGLIISIDAHLDLAAWLASGGPSGGEGGYMEFGHMEFGRLYSDEGYVQIERGSECLFSGVIRSPCERRRNP
jgi:hypothetical protein